MDLRGQPRAWAHVYYNQANRKQDHCLSQYYRSATSHITSSTVTPTWRLEHDSVYAFITILLTKTHTVQQPSSLTLSSHNSPMSFQLLSFPYWSFPFTYCLFTFPQSATHRASSSAQKQPFAPPYTKRRTRSVRVSVRKAAKNNENNYWKKRKMQLLQFLPF